MSGKWHSVVSNYKQWHMIFKSIPRTYIRNKPPVFHATIAVLSHLAGVACSARRTGLDSTTTIHTPTAGLSAVQHSLTRERVNSLHYPQHIGSL